MSVIQGSNEHLILK